MVLETERRASEFGKGEDGEENQKKFYIDCVLNEKFKDKENPKILVSIDVLTAKED